MVLQGLLHNALQHRTVVKDRYGVTEQSIPVGIDAA